MHPGEGLLTICREITGKRELRLSQERVWKTEENRREELIIESVGIKYQCALYKLSPLQWCDCRRFRLVKYLCWYTRVCVCEALFSHSSCSFSPSRSCWTTRRAECVMTVTLVSRTTTLETTTSTSISWPRLLHIKPRPYGRGNTERRPSNCCRGLSSVPGYC